MSLDIWWARWGAPRRADSDAGRGWSREGMALGSPYALKERSSGRVMSAVHLSDTRHA